MPKPTIKRTIKKLTPAQSREYDALMKQVEEDRPALKAWAKSGFAFDRKLRELMQALKAAREEQQISLAELARRTGIAKGNLSKLENDSNANPTLETILRYAEAIDTQVKINLTRTPRGRASKKKAG